MESNDLPPTSSIILPNSLNFVCSHETLQRVCVGNAPCWNNRYDVAVAAATDFRKGNHGQNI